MLNGETAIGEAIGPVEEPAASAAHGSSLTQDRIEIALPARPEYVAVVRLATAGLAGRTGLSFDDAEDLKLVLGEACNVAILSGASRLTIRFELQPDRITARIVHDGRLGERRAREVELAMFLMRCLMDEVETGAAGTTEVITVTKGYSRP